MKKKIAIVGGGISGLTCAWKLASHHEVTLFEQHDYIGGHTHTVDVSVASGRYAIDTGFIVCNDRTYPEFMKLLGEWQVELQKTSMSFSVSCMQTGLEYNGNSIDSLFAQRRNILSPSFYRLLYGIYRINQCARKELALPEKQIAATLADFLQKYRLSGPAITHYLAPMTAAIWSTPLTAVDKFPLLFFLQFCENHGLFNVLDRPQWYVIKGGSQRYIEAMLKRCKVQVNSSHKVMSVRRADATTSHRGANNPVSLRLLDGTVHLFDKVIFACHSDEALALLEDACNVEKQVLGAIRYQDNEVILHTDERLLPRNKRAWAAWNYLLPDRVSRLPTLTYNMNILQGLSAPETFCVTLNRSNAIAPECVLGRYQYAHPQFDMAAVNAQARVSAISGHRDSHFCGAYWRYGFHEDGVRSGLRVCDELAKSI